MSTATRAEYVVRVNHVMDYIERNLGARLTLDELAGVACFSPYHFHRIFAAMVGETLTQFIRRLRLERAAALLVAHPGRPVTTIALDCGFSSSAAFARAFREAFGMSASDWRLAGWAQHAGIVTSGTEDSKIGQSQRKMRGDYDVTPRYRDGIYQQRTWRVTMNDQPALSGHIEVREEPAFTVAYIRHTGAYQGNAELFGRLFGKLMQWAGPRGLLRPDTRIITVYHDNPDLTDDDKLRISVGISVPEDTPVSGEIGAMTIPGGTYAFGRFEIASDEYGAAWDAVFSGWLPESGYQPADGLCYEQYHNDPEQHPEHKMDVSICVPVRPL